MRSGFEVTSYYQNRRNQTQGVTVKVSSNRTSLTELKILVPKEQVTLCSHNGSGLMELFCSWDDQATQLSADVHSFSVMVPPKKEQQPGKPHRDCIFLFVQSFLHSSSNTTLTGTVAMVAL